MPAGPNYLLGKGENLTVVIDPPGGGRPKPPRYSFLEAKTAITPKVVTTARALDELPPIACPGDEAVAVLTLHPAYLAKSYFPAGLLHAVGLRSVGSRSATVVPRNRLVANPEERFATTDLFVAGPRDRFRSFARVIAQWDETSAEAGDFIKIEDFRMIRPEERIKPLRSDSLTPLMEVVLYNAGLKTDLVIQSFADFLSGLGVQLDRSRGLEAGGFQFLPVPMPRDVVPEIARFSFLRVAREMPALRALVPNVRVVSSRHDPFACRLPIDPPLAPDLRVAIFDGGLPTSPDLSRWVTSYDVSGIGPADPDYQEHGLAVTSALLFGSIVEGHDLSTPYTPVDHYRVLDAETAKHPQAELYPVLKRIKDLLETNTHEFIVLCLGPDLPVEDDDVHPWTSIIDPFLAKGDKLMAIAAGNGGERDAEAGLNRIQPPADCINGLAIGACDSQHGPWDRAPYSSVGPSRSPGRDKPDALAFGGTHQSPFWVLSPGTAGLVFPSCGTSIACPNAMRSGLGIRTHLGPELRPLTIKALMLHRSEVHPIDLDQLQHGWGRIRHDLDELLTCRDNEVYVVYQGQLSPKQFMRARIPVPSIEIPGIVQIAATICIGSEIDPEYPATYTRSGVEVVFRPNMKKQTARRGKNGKTVLSKLPGSKPFFGSRRSMSEAELRDDAHKWEPTLCASRNFKGTSISDPVFELHHNPRTGGADTINGAAIPYAMIVSIYTPELPDLYNRVFVRYKGTLEPLIPIIDIHLSST